MVFLHPCNAKEHYQSFIRKKNRKSLKKTKIISYQRTTFEKSNIGDIKSVHTEHPKTSHKLSETISLKRQKVMMKQSMTFFIQTQKQK